MSNKTNTTNEATKRLEAQRQNLRKMQPANFEELREGYYGLHASIARMENQAAHLTEKQRAALAALKELANQGEMKWLGILL